MSKPNFTPGPWEVVPQNGDAYDEFSGLVGIAGPEQTNSLGKKYTLYVCQCVKPEDANLIRASLDMYKALETVEKMLILWDRHDDPVFQDIQSALRKARNE